jgi:uncharacterized membrane protein
MNLLNLMRASREKLSPNWVIASLICFLYALIVGVPSSLNSYGELLSFLLAGPLQLGMAIYFLNLLNDRPASVENLIEGFKPLLKILFVYLLISVATFFGLLLFIIPGIIVALGLSMTYFILVEKPELTIEESLKESWRLTQGFKLRLFILHLRFVPWYLLGLLCFGIGIFIVMPWHHMTLANFYNYLMQERAE